MDLYIIESTSKTLHNGRLSQKVLLKLEMTAKTLPDGCLPQKTQLKLNTKKLSDFFKVKLLESCNPILTKLRLFYVNYKSFKI